MGRSVSPAPAWRRGPPTATHRTGRGAKKNAGRPLLVHLGARGGGRPLTAPPAWCQDPLAMCACSRENNQAPNLATLLQGTASTPAVVIDSSPSPGGRGHGRAPDPTRRPPRAPRIDAGQRHDLARGRAPRAPCPGAPAAGARGRRTRPGAALWAASSPEGAGKRRGRDHSSHQGPYGEAGRRRGTGKMKRDPARQREKGPLSHTGDRFPGTSRKRRDTVVLHDSSPPSVSET